MGASGGGGRAGRRGGRAGRDRRDTGAHLEVGQLERKRVLVIRELLVQVALEDFRVLEHSGQKALGAVRVQKLGREEMYLLVEGHTEALCGELERDLDDALRALLHPPRLEGEVLRLVRLLLGQRNLQLARERNECHSARLGRRLGGLVRRTVACALRQPRARSRLVLAVQVVLAVLFARLVRAKRPLAVWRALARRLRAERLLLLWLALARLLRAERLLLL